MSNLIESLEESAVDMRNEGDKSRTQMIDQFEKMIEVLTIMAQTEDRFFEESHIRFVEQKSVATARLLNVKEQDIFEIRIAALLHDIGKTMLPDTVRIKFRPEMTSDEYQSYVLHPVFGKEMLGRLKGFERVSKIIAQHHERVDGSGFPYRLREGEILPGALIIGVVDSYHNIISRKTKDKHSKQDQHIISNSAAYLASTQARVKQGLNHLTSSARILYNYQVVEAFTDLIERERLNLGDKMVKRLSINQLKSGMSLAENYFTNYGMLIASRGETITPKMIQYLMEYAERGELSAKVLAFINDDHED